jgi:hypothetical protein
MGRGEYPGRGPLDLQSIIRALRKPGPVTPDAAVCSGVATDLGGEVTAGSCSSWHRTAA